VDDVVNDLGGRGAVTIEIINGTHERIPSGHTLQVGVELQSVTLLGGMP
jgi:hypothetical protein